MKTIQFYSGKNLPLEMHKARVVQQLHLAPVEERLKALEEAGNNLYLLKNPDIFLDMLTDSGVNAMSDHQLASMMDADDAYAGSRTFFELKDKVAELFGMEHLLPTHQGRACENILASSLVKPGDVCPMNYHFTTTKAHIVKNGGSIVEVVKKSGLVTDSSDPFKGNFDLEELERVIKEVGPERIPFVRIEAGTNLIGGQNRYLAEWLNGEPKNITADFVERGRALGLDITKQRRILVCSFYHHANNSTYLQTMQVIEQAEEYLKKRVINMNSLNLYYKSGSTLVCLVTAIANKEIEVLALELKKQVEELYPIKLAIGIDSIVDNFAFMKTALIRAHKSNNACMRTHKRDIRFYDDLNMEVFTDEVSELSKIEFIHRIFKNFSDEDIRDSILLLEVFYDLEGSINKTAERLFIHKNTLQYKLRKIAERTGYDPRSIRHSSLFYITIFFYRYVSETMQNP